MGLSNTFRSLQYRNYRLFFAGQSISLIGIWLQCIATPWLVYDRPHSVFLLGLVGFIGQLPISLLAPFAGVFSDRWNRYHILVVTQILPVILAWLALAGQVSTMDPHINQKESSFAAALPLALLPFVSSLEERLSSLCMAPGPYICLPSLFSDDFSTVTFFIFFIFAPPVGGTGGVEPPV